MWLFTRESSSIPRWKSLPTAVRPSGPAKARRRHASSQSTAASNLRWEVHGTSGWEHLGSPPKLLNHPRKNKEKVTTGAHSSHSSPSQRGNGDDLWSTYSWQPTGGFSVNSQWTHHPQIGWEIHFVSGYNWNSEFDPFGSVYSKTTWLMSAEKINISLKVGTSALIRKHLHSTSHDVNNHPDKKKKHVTRCDV